MQPTPFPTPRNLVRQWQEGEIEREEMQCLMAQHQIALLDEAEQYHRNPIAGYLEGLLNKRAARRLTREYSEAAIRELFMALSWLDDFPPSAFLWNADHWDLALHVFFRTKAEPVFRVRELMIKSSRAVILIEHGSTKKSEICRERITFQRHWKGDMEVTKREKV